MAKKRAAGARARSEDGKHLFPVYLLDEEKATIAEAVELSGIGSMSGYIRVAALEKARRDLASVDGPRGDTP